MSKPDDASFEDFVHAAWPSLRQGAYALTGSVADAEDLVQTVLVRTYASWARVGRDNPVAYVRRGLVNAYVDTWRRRQRFRTQPARRRGRARRGVVRRRGGRRPPRPGRQAGPALAARAHDARDAALLRPPRARGGSPDGLLRRHGEEHLLARTGAAPDPGHYPDGGTSMTHDQFKQEVDAIDTGLPQRPDLTSIRARGRTVRRRRRGIAAVSGLAAAAVLAVPLATVVLDGSDDATTQVADDASPTPTPDDAGTDRRPGGVRRPGTADDRLGDRRVPAGPSDERRRL